MINRHVIEQQAASIEGRIIFKSGGVDVSHFLAQKPPVMIGLRLGKVTRITSPSRIFYTSNDGSEKYVSTSGIGYMCDTEEEAKALDILRDETSKKIRVFVSTAYSEMQSKIDSLVSDIEERQNNQPA